MWTKADLQDDPEELYPDGKWQGSFGLYINKNSGIWYTTRLKHLVSVYTNPTGKIVYLYLTRDFTQASTMCWFITSEKAVTLYNKWCAQVIPDSSTYSVRTVFLSDNIGKELRNAIVLEML